MPFFHSVTLSDADSSKTNSPPSSPQRRPLSVSNILMRIHPRPTTKSKPCHIESSSNPSPLTHPALVGQTCPRKEPLRQRDVFLCKGAVDVPRLLRASRSSLFKKAVNIGANALVDEYWTCTIRRPKHRSNGHFRVQIIYSASATRAQRPDPNAPVALDKARSVPGLMTVLERE